MKWQKSGLCSVVALFAVMEGSESGMVVSHAEASGLGDPKSVSVLDPSKDEYRQAAVIMHRPFMGTQPYIDGVSASWCGPILADPANGISRASKSTMSPLRPTQELTPTRAP